MVVTATETTKADVEIDATDRYVMPGGVDVHTHMDLPFGGSWRVSALGERRQHF